jgi:hypothetical protein
MNEMFKRLGVFLMGLAGVILICGVAFLLVRGLDWIFENTLPSNAIGIPPLLPSIVALCIIVLIVIWVSEKPMRKRALEEKRLAIADEQAVRPFSHSISELGKIGSPKAVEILCKIAGRDADWRTQEALDALVGIGDPAVGGLSLMLSGWGTGWNKDSKFYAASALEKIGSPKAIKALCKELTQDISIENSRACARHALVNIGSPAVEELCLTLNKKDCIRAYAAIALGEIGDARAIEPLRKRLQHIDNPIQRFVSWAFLEKINFGYGVCLTKWDWEIDSLRKALLKCGWSPTMTNSRTAQNSTHMKNTMKRKILITTLAALILTCLFPPWLNILDVPYHAHQRTPAGHEFILFPPDSKGGAWSVEIDLKMLFVEWIALAAVTGMVWVLAVKPAWSRNEKSPNPQKFIPPPSNSQN